MHVKTSISLPEELVADMDRSVHRFGSRSALVATAVKSLLDEIEREERDARDRVILNDLADRLNEEAADALVYQTDE